MVFEVTRRWGDRLLSNQVLVDSLVLKCSSKQFRARALWAAAVFVAVTILSRTWMVTVALLGGYDTGHKVDMGLELVVGVSFSVLGVATGKQLRGNSVLCNMVACTVLYALQFAVR